MIDWILATSPIIIIAYVYVRNAVSKYTAPAVLAYSSERVVVYTLTATTISMALSLGAGVGWVGIMLNALVVWLAMRCKVYKLGAELCVRGVLSTKRIVPDQINTTVIKQTGGETQRAKIYIVEAGGAVHNLSLFDVDPRFVKWAESHAVLIEGDWQEIRKMQRSSMRVATVACIIIAFIYMLVIK